MKPFIKPQAPGAAAAAASPSPAKVSPGELAVAAVARAIADEGERAAYLDRVCEGDAGRRARIEAWLSEKAALPATVPTAEILPVNPRPATGGMAIVPMPDMQLTPTGQGRQSSFPWVLATVLAAAVGALVVVFLNEKTGRAVAESQKQTALLAQKNADEERTAALAGALEAKTIAARAEEKRTEADRLHTDAEARRLAAEAESKKAREDAEKSRQSEVSAKSELERSKGQLADLSATQKAAQDELATTLAKYAAVLVEEGRHGEAEVPARQALAWRSKTDPAAWETQEARFTLGSALMGKGNTAEAEKELLAAVAGMEPLVVAGGDPARARYTVVVKKLAQLYSATGRRKEASEVRKKLER